MREADVVIGYGPYVDQCADLLDGQEVVRGAMGEESARADEALARAPAPARGSRWCRSGDAGVHGMAARTLALAAELADDERPTIEVVPGVTAALAAAARLGAPLADDWATLSLSDLHLPWETVERRLTALAAVRDRARALQPALARRGRAVRARAGDPARAPRAGHAGRRRDRRRAPGRARASARRWRRSTRRR